MIIKSISKNDLNKLGVYENEGIRQLRKPLLEAFDVYKSNIAYGVESETSTEHLEIIVWYEKLLNKDKDALENIPAKILRYL